MADQVLITLNSKRRDIEAHIGSLEAELEQVRRDLSAVLATIKVFSSEGPKVTAYMNMTRPFPRRELPDLARQAPERATDGRLSTAGIAAHVITHKSLDIDDMHLRNIFAHQVSLGFDDFIERLQIDVKQCSYPVSVQVPSFRI
jgi:hypothetical protein